MTAIIVASEAGDNRLMLSVFSRMKRLPAEFEDLTERAARRWPNLLLIDRRPADSDQQLRQTVLSCDLADEVATGRNLGHVGKGAGGQTDDGALEQHC